MNEVSWAVVSSLEYLRANDPQFTVPSEHPPYLVINLSEGGILVFDYLCVMEFIKGFDQVIHGMLDQIQKEENGSQRSVGDTAG